MKVHANDCNHRLSIFVVANENNDAPAMPVLLNVSQAKSIGHT